MSALLLSSGTKGKRASLPHASIALMPTRTGTQGQATDIEVTAREVLGKQSLILDILSKNTGQPVEKLAKDTDRIFYMTPHEAKEYGLIDRVAESNKIAQPQAALV
jgi:ATP-dependent Clp protease protease subunit